MKTLLHSFKVLLIGLILIACQAQPPTSIDGIKVSKPIDFYKENAAQWVTLQPPEGWSALLGRQAKSATVIVTDNPTNYLAQTPDDSIPTTSVVLLLLPDQGTAQQVLEVVIKRLGISLTQRIGDIALETINGQGYAWTEYNGVEVDQTPRLYFMAVIATTQRSVLVFSTIDPEQAATIRPIFRAIMKSVVLH